MKRHSVKEVAILTIFLSHLPGSVFQAKAGEGITEQSLSTPYTTIPVAGYPIFQKGLPNIRPPALPAGALEEQTSDGDPLGHWSSSVEGWQMSVRLTTNRFMAGDSIVAFVILRNDSTKSNPLHLYRGVHTPLCNFELWDRADKQCEPPKLLLSTSGAGGRMVPAKTQYRTWVCLDKVYDLSEPGRYRVRGVAPVPIHGVGPSPVYTNVISGMIDFDVLPRPAAPAPPAAGDGRK